MLKPEPTFYIQIVLFLALWPILKRWWFDPAMRVIAARAARSDGSVAEARAVQSEAERLEREHAAALEQTRHEAQREVQDILRAGEAEQKRLVAEATGVAARALAEARGRIAEEVALARRELHGQVREIAREVAQRILGRAV